MNAYLKPVTLLSLILGIIFGFLFLIPDFTFNFLVCTMCCISSIAIILYLKKQSLVGILEPKDGALIGAISGFISTAAASTIYIPLFWGISSLFKSFGAGLGLSAVASILIQNFNILLALLYVFFLGMLVSIFNAFTGMITVFVYEKIDTEKPEDTTHFVIEED